MRKLYIILTIILLTAVSCEEHRTIPRKKLSKIYYEMYLADEALSSSRKLRRMTDSLQLYEPIFNKYGYTTDDYLYTVDIYLENPAKYRKIFDRTKKMLEEKKEELQAIYTAETYYDRLMRWRFLDTLDFIVKSEGKGLGFHTWAQFFFNQIEPVSLKEEPLVFSLIVPRPELEPEYLDSLRAIAHKLDSIRIDSLLRDTLYIPYPLLAEQISADSVVRDSTAADSLTINIDTISNVFARAYIFAEHFVIDTTSAIDTLLKDSTLIADSILLKDTIALADSIIPIDSTAIKDSVIADSTKSAIAVPQEHYGSHIVNFILNDSAYFDSEPYIYAPDTLIVKIVKKKNANRKTEETKSGTTNTITRPSKKDMFEDVGISKPFFDKTQSAKPSSVKDSDNKGKKDKSKPKTESKNKTSITKEKVKNKPAGIKEESKDKPKKDAPHERPERKDRTKEKSFEQMTEEEREAMRKSKTQKSKYEQRREEEMKKRQEIEEATKARQERLKNEQSRKKAQNNTTRKQQNETNSR